MIEYSTDTGVNWTVIDTVEDSATSYEWTLPAENSDQCLVRIGDVENEVYDQSNAVFTIYQCTLAFDATNDCSIGIDDFAFFAMEWMQCGNPFDPSCIGYVP